MRQAPRRPRTSVFLEGENQRPPALDPQEESRYVVRRRWSEGLDLDTSSRKPRLGSALFLAVKIENADLGQTRELILARAWGDPYPRLLGPNELPVLVEPQRDVCRVEFTVADPLPCTMGDAESRVCISTSEECSVRREGEEYYALTSRATG